MLSAEQVRSFRRDGLLVLRGAIGRTELEQLQRATGEIVDRAVEFGRQLDRDDPVPFGEREIEVDMGVYRDPGYLYGADGRGHRIFRRAEWLWQRDPIFAHTTANPVLLNAVWALLETPFVPITESLVVKLPNAGAAVPWHRDVERDALLEVGGDTTRDFTLDIYLDPSTSANGALWAIPGSHRGPPATVDPHDWSRDDAVLLTAEPGDVLVHATSLLHGSPLNNSSDSRRTVYLHFRGPSGLSAASTRRSINVARNCEPIEWARRQATFLDDAIAARPSAAFGDTELYEGPVEVPTLLGEP